MRCAGQLCTVSFMEQGIRPEIFEEKPKIPMGVHREGSDLRIHRFCLNVAEILVCFAVIFLARVSFESKSKNAEYRQTVETKSDADVRDFLRICRANFNRILPESWSVPCRVNTSLMGVQTSKCYFSETRRKKIARRGREITLRSLQL